MSDGKNSEKHNSVMLVDDNEIDNLINEKMIEGTGFAHNIFISSSAISAIDFLKNITKVNNTEGSLLPSIIFLDINMPIMDGFQFLDEFENLSKQIKDNCKVVMLSSSMNPRDIEQAKNNDFVHEYFSKPLKEEDLEKIKI
ncbi:MAG: hypothetical protein COC01_02715 [Bacteroidetes bacterium]|nr:MAG: hypothetical protein COC01_02715 [Bacteroidota bacterium]